MVTVCVCGQRYLRYSQKVEIIRLIVNNPLNPSIKFAPLITKRKQSNTNIDEKSWFAPSTRTEKPPNTTKFAYAENI